MQHMLGKERAASAASLGAPPAYEMVGGYSGSSREFGADGQRGAVGRGVYGGGAMPGPQYLLNMHPGVPVQVGRM